MNALSGFSPFENPPQLQTSLKLKLWFIESFLYIRDYCRKIFPKKLFLSKYLFSYMVLEQIAHVTSNTLIELKVPALKNGIKKSFYHLFLG